MATTDEKIRALEEQANVVATLRDLLNRAKRGELRHIVVAAELAEDNNKFATVYTTLKEEGDVPRLIGLIEMAKNRLLR